VAPTEIDEADIVDAELVDDVPPHADTIEALWPAMTQLSGGAEAVEAPESPVPAKRSTHRNAPETGFPPRRTPSPRPAPARPSRRAAAPTDGAALHDMFSDDDLFANRPRRTARPRPIARSRPKETRRPALGLPVLLVFALAAAFFAWVSATPLWLAVGHGNRGTATVASCNVHGIDRSCADFTAADHSFTTVVTLLGPAADHVKAGQKVSATVVSRESSLAYAGGARDYALRWVPGVVLLLLCGLGIAWATGALRLGNRRARRWAVAGSIAGPMLLLAGMLAYTW
jgi:hypothetical protein